MHETIRHSRASPHLPASTAGAALRLLTKFVDLLLCWQERRRQRNQLAQLGDHMLKDIGLTRAEALGEIEKPFWRP